MSFRINVHFLPALVTPEQLAGGVVVVIDVLRATTTIVHALAAGAREVIPCLEVDEAREIASAMNEPCVLGGERGGLQIDGFDLGNSPAEYTAEAVGNKIVVFTTTNGTRAMQQCRDASRVLIGALVNFSAVCNAISEEDSIHLLCAGTRNEITREDVLLAGAIVDDLRDGGVVENDMNDQALLAADAWCVAAEMMTRDVPLQENLKSSRGGRNLLSIGQASDIDIAARIDTFDVVPELDLKAWRIRPTS